MMTQTKSIVEKTLLWLSPLRLCPYRLTFQFPINAEYEIPRLRGIWGRALHLLDEECYRTVFEGTGPTNLKTPRYLIRPSELNIELVPPLRNGYKRESIDFITWGVTPDNRDSVENDGPAALLRAWDIASGMGIGKERLPFVLERVEKITPFSSPNGISIVQMIHGCSFPESRPCRLLFPVPVRITDERRSNYSPDLTMIVKAALTRCALLRLQSTGELDSFTGSVPPASILPDFADELLTEVTRLKMGEWTGIPIRTHRYSGRQKGEIDLNGATGSLDLPSGCGALGPILAAAAIVHVGKSTTIGLGRLCLQTLPD